ncbi:hypothetical protein JCM10213v2_004137 [Rhodosporidiobolus nylandii]
MQATLASSKTVMEDRQNFVTNKTLELILAAQHPRQAAPASKSAQLQDSGGVGVEQQKAAVGQDKTGKGTVEGD